MQVRIEAGRMRVAEMFQKLLFVSAVADVIADVIGVLQREDYEIMTFAVAERA